MQAGMEEKLEDIRSRIGRACARAGRAPESVRLLAVSKGVSPERIAEAAAAGVAVLGENRVQEARQKIPRCPGHLEWHFIGHLQSNKVRECVCLFHMIHAVDSLRLLELIHEAADAEGRSVSVCLEVNVAGEATKHGLAPEAVPQVLEASARYHRVDVLGLMAIPPFCEEPEDVRPFFRRLREWRDQWQADFGVPLGELSMGMSHDFEVAIEEGATWIRLGAALFGPRGGE